MAIDWLPVQQAMDPIKIGSGPDEQQIEAKDEIPRAGRDGGMIVGVNPVSDGFKSGPERNPGCDTPKHVVLDLVAPKELITVAAQGLSIQLILILL